MTEINVTSMINIETRNVVNRIFDSFGVDILLKGSRFCALFNDLAPSLKLESRVMQRLNQESLFPAIYQELGGSHEISNGSARIELLLDGAGFSESWKEIVLFSFGFLNEEEVSEHKGIGYNSSPITQNATPSSLSKELLDGAIDRVTAEGPIIIEDSLRTYACLEFVNGIKFSRGFISPYMVQDSEKSETILEDPYILITNATIMDKNIIRKIIDMLYPSKRSLLIIAADISEDALSGTIEILNSFPCVMVKAPSYGDRRKDILRDIAVVTGGNAIIDSNESRLNDIILKDLGQSKKVIIHSEETIIVDGACDKNALLERIYHIKTLIEQSRSDFDREKLQERYENLSRGVAIIRVGGKTISESKQLKEELSNALRNLRRQVVSKAEISI